ncbi:MAG: nitroreductase family protein [Candidatus Hodarchaeales archaeon]|jgi:nitroreductase
MDFQTAVNKRKMIRSFLDKPIEEEKVAKIIKNFFKCPSAGFSQGIELLVLNSKKDVNRYFRCLGTEQERKEGFLKNWSKLENAQVIMIPIAHKQTYLDRYARPDKGWIDKSENRWPVPFWLTDTAMGTMIALLTVVDQALGAVFVGLSKEKQVREEFTIPDDYKPIGAIIIGYPDPSDPQSPSLKRGRRKKEDVVRYGNFR